MPVEIEKSIDSPKIVLDEGKSIFLIEGFSYMADAYKSYQVVIEWVKVSLPKIKRALVCEFKFNMLSSASRKMVYEILLAINQSELADDIQIHWYYANYDEDMKEIGEIYADQVKMQFRFFPF